MADYLMATYTRLPVQFERGEGVWLWDTEGRQYLDALGGIAVCALGHAHPGVAQAIADQARRLVHTSNLYAIPLQEDARFMEIGFVSFKVTCSSLVIQHQSNRTRHNTLSSLR